MGGQSVLSAALLGSPGRGGRRSSRLIRVPAVHPSEENSYHFICPEAVVASTPAGSIAYHMNLRVIDMLGLNDAHIGHTSTADSGKVGLVIKKAMISTFSPDHPITVSWGNVAVLPYPVDKEGMAKKLVRNQSTSCGLSRDFMTPMNSFVSS